MAGGGLQAGLAFGCGNHTLNISFSIITDNIVVARELCELSGYIGLGVGVTTLGVLLGYRLFKPLIQDVVNVVFGYDRPDQENPNAEAGSLHVKLRCLTEKRFLEVLQDFESGGIKQRLENEFPQVGIKVEGLKVEIVNMEEVEKTKTEIIKGLKQEQEKQPDLQIENLALHPSEPQIIIQGGAFSWPLWRSDTEVKQYMDEVKNAAEHGFMILRKGGSAVDAVEEAVRVMENCVYFNAGYGSVLNNDGEVQCDAMIMDGSTLSTGAVISGRHFQHPVSLAKKIMNDTYHCALSGEGALKYATEHGFPTCDPDYLVTRRAERLKSVAYSDFPGYVRHRLGRPAYETESLKETDSADPETKETKETKATKETKGALGSDTVSAVARDASGRLACAVSTGGIPGSLKGRVSDAAMVGCGGYANEHGAATTSGQGELLMKMTLAREVVYMMESGRNAQDAAENALRKMEKKFGQDSGVGGVIAIDKEGNFGKAFTTAMMGWVSIKNNETEQGFDHNMGM